jgi:acyl carrier protein
MTNLDRLRTAFRESLALPDDFDVDDLEYRGIEGWDSLAHMTLVAGIEDTFQVMIDTDDVIDLSSFGRAKEILAKHGVDLAA